MSTEYKVGDEFVIEIGGVFKAKQADYEGDYPVCYLYQIKNSKVFLMGTDVDKLARHEENPFSQEDCDRARREGFEEGVKSVGTYDEDLKAEAYQKGLDDAWEVAKKIVLEKANDGLSPKELEEIFKTRSLLVIFVNYSATEAISKIKAYEEQKKAEEEIKVGDEVSPNELSENPIIVTRKWIDDYDRPCIDTINRSGRTWNYLEKDVHKTGRHFDVDGILKAIREE